MERYRSLYKRHRSQQGIHVSLLLLLTILFFCIVNLFASDREFSDSENRQLAQKPKLTWTSLTDGSYFAGIDDYLADQFVGRDFWISLRLKFTELMGATESNGVLLCDDDYLMEKTTAPGEFLDENLAAISSFAARNKSVKTYVNIVPTAACVLAEKLPANAPVRDQAADLRAIEQGLTGVSFLNVTESLKAHSQEQIYYRTDHHWTTLGAYYAFLDLARDLGITPVTEYDVYTVSNTFDGTLASKSGSHPEYDTVQIYAPKTDVDYIVHYPHTGETTATLYSRAALDGKDHYAVFFGGNYPQVDITTTANTGRTLLLFKDSYANCMVQLLIPYFDKIIMIDSRYYSDNAETLVQSQGVTDVLFLYNINTFHEDSTLYKTLGN